MKLTEKLEYIQSNHFNDWLTTRSRVAEEFSDRQLTFCICGRLATGFHESHCRKFQNAITRETLYRLKNLFPKNPTHPQP